MYRYVFRDVPICDFLLEYVHTKSGRFGGDGEMEKWRGWEVGKIRIGEVFTEKGEEKRRREEDKREYKGGKRREETLILF